jgi:hypothetical protein
MTLFRHVASGTYPGGEVWSFTLHTQGAPTATVAEAAFVTATAALWTGKLDGVISTQISMTGCSTASIDPLTGKQITRLADVVARPGVAVGEPLPAQVALVISMRSDLATRAGRGRFYLPPLDVSSTASGKVAAGKLTTVVTAVKAMLDSLIGAGLQPVLYGKTTHLSTTVTKFDVGNVWDTQRRRRDKLVEVRTQSAL